MMQNNVAKEILTARCTKFISRAAAVFYYILQKRGKGIFIFIRVKSSVFVKKHMK
ncbi:hypothetical protein NCCP28_23030 [Niallia sp. NCCP-28]|nr:hypothetical protein NCCP28_23030 [Niallia sp. NCCP-28]